MGESPSLSNVIMAHGIEGDLRMLSNRLTGGDRFHVSEMLKGTPFPLDSMGNIKLTICFGVLLLMVWEALSHEDFLALRF